MRRPNENRVYTNSNLRMCSEFGATYHTPGGVSLHRVNPQFLCNLPHLTTSASDRPRGHVPRTIRPPKLRRTDKLVEFGPNRPPLQGILGAFLETLVNHVFAHRHTFESDTTVDHAATRSGAGRPLQRLHALKGLTSCVWDPTATRLAEIPNT